MTVTRLNDTFTDADGTALESHIMNVGPGWVEQLGLLDWTIQSNKAVPIQTAGLSNCITSDGGVTRGVLIASLTFPAQDINNTSGLAFRVVDDNNLWFAQVLVNTRVAELDVVERLAGANTIRASTPISDPFGTTKTLVCAYDDQSVFATFVPGGPSVLYQALLPYPTETKVGMYSLTPLITLAPVQFDNFLLQTTTGPPQTWMKRVYQQLISR